MLKRVLKMTSSPVGLALTVAGVVLALSPEARRATRQLLVKGTASVLGAVDTVRDSTREALDVTEEAAEQTVGVLGAAAERMGTAARETAEETLDILTPDAMKADTELEERPYTH